MTTADAPALSYSSAPWRWVLAVTVLGSGIASLDAPIVLQHRPADHGRDFHTGVQVGIEGGREMLYRLFVAGHRRRSLEAVLSSDMKPAATGGEWKQSPGLSQWGPG